MPTPTLHHHNFKFQSITVFGILLSTTFQRQLMPLVHWRPFLTFRSTIVLFYSSPTILWDAYLLLNPLYFPYSRHSSTSIFNDDFLYKWPFHMGLRFYTNKKLSKRITKTHVLVVAESTSVAWSQNPSAKFISCTVREKSLDARFCYVQCLLCLWNPHHAIQKATLLNTTTVSSEPCLPTSWRHGLNAFLLIIYYCSFFQTNFDLIADWIQLRIFNTLLSIF